MIKPNEPFTVENGQSILHNNYILVLIVLDNCIVTVFLLFIVRDNWNKICDMSEPLNQFSNAGV